MRQKYNAGDYVLVQYGGPDFCHVGYGQQLAQLIEYVPYPDRHHPTVRYWLVRKWRAKSKRWTGRVMIVESRIIKKAPSCFLPPLENR